MTQQMLPGPHSGVKTTITKGDPMSRSMGHYGKGHTFSAPTAPAKQPMQGSYPKAPPAPDPTTTGGAF